LYERGRYAWAATGVMLHHAGNVGEQHDSWQYAVDCRCSRCLCAGFSAGAMPGQRRA
jgi:hypothetical protein